MPHGSGVPEAFVPPRLGEHNLDMVALAETLLKDPPERAKMRSIIHMRKWGFTNTCVTHPSPHHSLSYGVMARSELLDFPCENRFELCSIM